jgi:hypothetical protein
MNVAAIFPQSRNFSAFAKPAARDHGNGICCAAVDFDKCKQTLAIFAVRVFNSEFVETKHRHAHPRICPAHR